MSEAQGYQRPELVCPAGTPAALRAAVDAGADAVYCGLQNETNARNFPGLNFTVAEVEQSLGYAHARDAKLLLAVNTFPPAGKFELWRDAIDAAARLGVDAVIVADMGVADYAARTHPKLRLHLSVQAGASSPEAIRFYCEQFGVKRVVLPRMLTVAEIAELHRQIPCEIEAFIFGNIGMMAEGRCSLSNYVTGASTNMDGVCSPAADVHYEEDAARNLTTRLGEVVIDCFAGAESAGYPTICKGRYRCGVRNDAYYAFEEPVSLNLSALLPDLMRAGVTALKIEGRQRSRAYVKSVVSAFRKAVDDIMAGREAAFASLLALTEGRRETEGAFPQQAMEIAVQAQPSELTLGPVLFNWSPESWRDFYFRIADEAPVAAVYLGEAICFKRAPLFEPYLDAVAARLKAAGKTVVRSTLAEVMSKQERKMVDDVCADRTATVEANDGSALLRLRGRPHHAGPFVNVYNERTLAVLARGGVCNVCLPPEMPAPAIQALAAEAAKLGVTIEVLVFGRLPLALSARCYHARAHGRSKDSCQFICNVDPDGMPLRTLEDKPFLAVNGIQTLSHDYLNLVGELADLQDMGVSRFRLSPHSCDMVAVAATFRDALDRRIDAGEAAARLDALKIDAPFSNGFYYGKPGYSWNRANLNN